MGERLTERQAQLAGFVDAYTEREGWAPTVQEMAQHMAVVSTNAVNDFLNILERKGAIVRRRRSARAIRVDWDALSGPDTELVRRYADDVLYPDAGVSHG